MANGEGCSTQKIPLKDTRQADQPKSSPVLADEDWRRMRTLVEDVVRQGEEKSAKKPTFSLHHFQVQNNLLLHKNEGLRKTLTAKKKHNGKGQDP
jgi:hypothetical protein